MSREEQILRLLRIILRSSNSVTQLLKKDMESFGLNATEFMILELLYHKGPQLAQAISRDILMASSSITYAIDNLEKKGFAKREVCSEDRRKIYNSLTESGKDLMDEIFPLHVAEIQTLFGDVSADDIDQLSKELKAIGLKAQEMNRAK